jgi:hypothetical protein
MDRLDPFSRPYSAISYGRIEDQGKSRLAVLKTYRQLTGISVEKVAQVAVSLCPPVDKGTDDLLAHL